MIKSFIRLEQVNPGFETQNIVTVRLSLPAAQYPAGPRRAAFFQQVIARLQSLPGVQSSAAISRLPMTAGNSSRGLTIEGRPNDGSGGAPAAHSRGISPRSFRSTGV